MIWFSWSTKYRESYWFSSKMWYKPVYITLLFLLQRRNHHTRWSRSKRGFYFYYNKIIFWLCLYILKNFIRHLKWYCWHLTERWIKIIMITIKKCFPTIRKILTDVSLKVHSSYRTNTVTIIWYKNLHTEAMRLVLKLCRKYI